MAGLEPRATFKPWTATTPSEPPSSSLPAQVAYKLVESNWPEAADSLHRRLLEAYFTENRTISEWPVLAAVAGEAGIDPDEFRAVAAEQRRQMANQVIDDHNDAIEQGITAVPTVLINDVLPVPGAQESQSYIAWIERILERQSRT